MSVVQRDYVIDDNGCWVWQRGTTGEGYGEKWLTELGRSVMAHRWYYARRFGAIPEGLVIDHLCRNRRCVNPAHLEPVTSGVNVLRGEGPPARNARKTHCKHGHSFDEENTRITSAGTRECIQCDRNLSAQYRQRRKERVASGESVVPVSPRPPAWIADRLSGGEVSDIPVGLCQCGCGESTRLAPYTSTRMGWRQGWPLRYVKGHNRRRVVIAALEQRGEREEAA